MATSHTPKKGRLQLLFMYLRLLWLLHKVTKYLRNPRLDPIKRVLIELQYEFIHTALEAIGWVHPKRRPALLRASAQKTVETVASSAFLHRVAGAADIERRGLDLF